MFKNLKWSSAAIVDDHFFITTYVVAVVFDLCQKWS